MENTKIFNIKDKTYKFSLDIIKFVKGLPRDFIGQVLSRQLIRSATSIGANITEGKAGSSRKDFINYYLIALKSANETVYWLRLIKDSTSNVANEVLVDEVGQIAKIIAKIVVNSKK